MLFIYSFVSLSGVEDRLANKKVEKLMRGVLLFLEKQVPVSIGSGSPAIRFIPMKNLDVRSCQV